MSLLPNKSWVENWTNLIKPSNFDCTRIAPNIYEIIVSPLEPGFGYTLGIALRRILLSSIRGSAVVAVRIDGVLHEFTAHSAIKEDVTEVILNVKKLKIKMHNTERRVIKFKDKLPSGSVIYANMFDCGNDVEILNPQQKICTVSQSSRELQIELVCESGKGYATAEEHNAEDLPVNVIPVDSVFSPISRVSYKVEHVRVGRVTNYDKLFMRVETDGSIEPDVAVALAAKIIQEQMKVFVTFEIEEGTTQVKEKDLGFDPVLFKKLDDEELSVRSSNCLKNANMTYIGDVVVKSESDMLKIPHFGRKSLNEIRAILKRYELDFGMTIQSWPPDNIEELRKEHVSEDL